MIRKYFILRPMAKRVSRLLGPWRNIFACLQPTVDCQSSLRITVCHFPMLSAMAYITCDSDLNIIQYTLV